MKELKGSILFQYHQGVALGEVAYAGFSKGGGGRKFRKFENDEDQNENFFTCPFSCPKSGEDQEKRSSLKFSRFLAQNWVKAQKRSSPTVCVLKPSAQVTKGVPCRNFAYYFMLIILSCRPNGGGIAQWPPRKYAPA